MQEEVVEVRYETAQAEKNVDRFTNKSAAAVKEIGAVSDATKRAVEGNTENLVRVVDRSLTSLERRTKALERSAQFAGKTGADRLMLQRDLDLKAAAGSERHIERINAAYEKLIATQGKAADSTSRIANAIRNPMQAAGDAWESFIGTIGKGGAIFGAVAVGVGVLGKQLYDLTAAQAAAAEQTVNFADRMDVSVEKAHELEVMARIANVSTGALEGSVRLLAVAMDDVGGAGKNTVRALRDLDVSTITLKGDQRELGQVFTDVLDKLSKVPTAAERVRLATAVFGRGAKEILPMVKNLDDLQRTVDKLRMNPQLIQDLARVDDDLDKMQEQWSIFKSTIAANVGIPVFEAINSMIEKMSEFNRDPANARAAGAFTAQSATGAPSEYAKMKDALAVERKRVLDEAGRWDALEGEKAQERFARVRKELQDEESINERLKSKRAERADAIAFLSGEKGVAGTAALAEKQRNLNAINSEIKSLELRTESIKRAKQAEEELQRSREKGLKLTAQIQQQMALGSYRVKLSDEDGPFARKERSVTLEQHSAEYRKQREFILETDRIELEALQTRLGTEDQALDQQRDRELRALQGMAALTLSQKLEVEQRKSEIEERYFKESMGRKARLLQIEQEIELAGVADESRRSAVMSKYAAIGERMNREYEAGITAIHQDSEITRAEITRDAMRDAFEDTKRSFESLLDEMLSGTKGWGDVVKSILKAAVLQPVKEAASTWLAAMFTGVRNSGGGGGGLGRILGGGIGLAGSAPVFGGTPPFLPAATAGGGGFGGFAQYGSGIAAYGRQLVGGLRSLGNLGRYSGPGSTGGAQAGAGVGGTTGGAMLVGGGLLAFDGLRRGGWLGVGETTAGGALIGGKFGGPWGAAIGASVGFMAGIVRLFIKGAVQKTIEKVQAVYGVKLDSDMAKQIVTIAKQQFAGNLDVAIRSPQIRDLIELYAMGTGQKRDRFGTPNVPVSLVQSGGSVFQQQRYYNSAPIAGLGGSLPSVAMPAESGPIVVQVTVPGAKEFFTQETVSVVVNNPRSVARANTSGNRQGVGRREGAAMTLAPALNT